MKREFYKFIACYTRVRSSSLHIFIYKIINNIFFKASLKVHNIKRYSYFIRYPSSIFYCTSGTTSTFSFYKFLSSSCQICIVAPYNFISLLLLKISSHRTISSRSYQPKTFFFHIIITISF